MNTIDEQLAQLRTNGSMYSRHPVVCWRHKIQLCNACASLHSLEDIEEEKRLVALQAKIRRTIEQ